jgi:hypothetical protein
MLEVNGDFFSLGDGFGKFFLSRIGAALQGRLDNDGLNVLKTDEAWYQLTFLLSQELLCILLMPIRPESKAECPIPEKQHRYQRCNRRHRTIRA